MFVKQRTILPNLVECGRMAATIDRLGSRLLYTIPCAPMVYWQVNGRKHFRPRICPS